MPAHLRGQFPLRGDGCHQLVWRPLQGHKCRLLTLIYLPAGGCKAIVNLLKHDSTAVQDAAVFATASLMKWNLADVKRSFAHNEGLLLS